MSIKLLLVVLSLSIGINSYTLHQQTQSQMKMTEAIRDYIFIKPFPLLCRNEIQ